MYKLLLLAAKNNGFGNKLYALFLMDKNEIVITNENIRDEIKREENKILKIRKEISKMVKWVFFVFFSIVLKDNY